MTTSNARRLLVDAAPLAAVGELSAALDVAHDASQDRGNAADAFTYDGTRVLQVLGDTLADRGVTSVAELDPYAGWVPHNDGWIGRTFASDLQSVLRWCEGERWSSDPAWSTP